MQIYELFVTLATHTSISISHQLSTALRHPLSEVFPTPSATTETQPSSPHAPPTTKEIKPSTSPANPSQALLQATLPYYQPLPSLPKETPLSTSPEKQPLYGDCHTESCPLFYCAKASHAQPHDIPLRSDRSSPSPYREYSSYPAEGKVLFSQRKMLLPVVVFFYLCT